MVVRPIRKDIKTGLPANATAPNHRHLCQHCPAQTVVCAPRGRAICGGRSATISLFCTGTYDRFVGSVPRRDDHLSFHFGFKPFKTSLSLYAYSPSSPTVINTLRACIYTGRRECARHSLERAGGGGDRGEAVGSEKKKPSKCRSGIAIFRYA